MKRFLPWILILLLAVGRVVAQEHACTAFVTAVYAAADLECADLAPGVACYGSAPLEIAGLDSGDFERPGDRLDGLQSLQAGPLDLSVGTWGLGVLRVVANQPDQTVTLVALGEVTMTDASTETAPVITVPVRVTFAGGTILRAEPDAAADQVVPLVVGQELPAMGKLADDSWLRLLLDDGRSGWVRADLVTPIGDVTVLPEVTPSDDAPQSLYGPWLALALESSLRASGCRAAPPGGLLLQTTQLVNMRVNAVDLQFDGTIYLQATPELSVHVLENTAQVTTSGLTETAAAGQRIRVRYDAEGEALTTPRVPEPYAYVQMRGLPFRLLPRAIPELPLNLIGVVTPNAPDQPLLADITADDACTVAAVNEVRLRQGPGRDYAIQGALYAGESANPDGRTEGLDGILWWRLLDGVWVRSDVVLAAGNCGDLPVVGIPPLIGELESGD